MKNDEASDILKDWADEHFTRDNEQIFIKKTHFKHPVGIDRYCHYSASLGKTSSQSDRFLLTVTIKKYCECGKLISDDTHMMACYKTWELTADMLKKELEACK